MFLEKRKVGNNIYLMLVKNNVYFKNGVKKAKKEIKDWVLDETDYISNEAETFKTKSKIIEIQTRNKNGIIRKTKEKILAYWSKDFY